jgi:hypothetical protein
VAALRGPEALAGAPRRPAFLANPGCGGWQGKGEALRQIASAVPGGLYREGGGPDAIARAVRDFGEAGADALVILGGDGTVQAVLSALAGGGWCPPLALVPCGTTNMTALDLGVKEGPVEVLQRLAAALRRNAPLELRTRAALDLAAGDGTRRCGMFFGAGLVAAGVRYFTRRLRRPGRTGEARSGIALLRYLGGLLVGRAGPPTRVRIREEGSAILEGEFSVILASTLDRLLLGLRPYWGREEAPVHFTAVRAAPRQIWRRLPGVLCGRGVPPHAAGNYHSRNLHCLELWMDGEYVLDGEIYPASAGTPLRIEPLPFRFLHA